jgi:hypothetical protein
MRPGQALANQRSYLNLQRLLASRPSRGQRTNMRLRARIKHSRIYIRNKWTRNLQAAPLRDYQHRIRPPHWEPTTMKRTPHTMGIPSLPHRLCRKPAHKTSAKRIYEYPTCAPRNGRFKSTSPVASQAGSQNVRKEDLRVSSPHAMGSLRVHISGWSQAALFRANSCRHVSV